MFSFAIAFFAIYAITAGEDPLSTTQIVAVVVVSGACLATAAFKFGSLWRKMAKVKAKVDAEERARGVILLTEDESVALDDLLAKGELPEALKGLKEKLNAPPPKIVWRSK